MGIVNLHGLYGVKLGATVVGGMQNAAINTGTEVRQETSSGEVFARWAAIVAQNPGLAFTTVDLDGALGLIGATGLDLETSNAIAYAQKRATGSTRAAGASHRSYTIVSGIGVRRQLTADHQGDATIGCELIAGWDTENDPILIADGISLPELPAQADQYRYGLGPAEVAGIAIAHKKSMAIDFGTQVRPEGGESDVWPTHVSIDSILPTITIRGVDPEWLKSTNIPLTGKSGTQANTTIYLRRRKRDLSGITIPGFEADATAKHIKMQADGYLTVDPAMDASGNDPAEITLLMNCTFDGTNDPVKITLNQAIT